MHALYQKADRLSRDLIGAAIEVHRHKGQLFSYMKLLDIPLGLLINFHEPVLKNGFSRMILPDANQGEEGDSVSSG
jgi:PD-(D/E)XK nuclease superfamily